MSTAAAIPSNPLQAMRRFVQRDVPSESCGLCRTPVFEGHRHLWEVEKQRVVCACEACASCFRETAGGRFQLIPRGARPLPDFSVTEMQWDGLALPIQLAFILQRGPDKKMAAYYPSPAGATESLLPLDTWQELVAANPVLREMQPNVEALLINRTTGARQYWIAPIDNCFELVGLIRLHWRGFSGGADVWREIKNFFTRLEIRHG